MHKTLQVAIHVYVGLMLFGQNGFSAEDNKCTAADLAELRRYEEKQGYQITERVCFEKGQAWCAVQRTVAAFEKTKTCKMIDEGFLHFYDTGFELVVLNVLDDKDDLSVRRIWISKKSKEDALPNR